MEMQVPTIEHGRIGSVPRRVWRGAVLHVALVPMIAALIGAAVLSNPLTAQGTTYKWVDEKGGVHYSDKLPPEAADKNRIELNAQGVPIKKTERALTPEQLKAREQDEARAREIEKQREEIARRDRALLSSYTTEQDIDLARKRAQHTLDAAIQSAEAYAAQLKIRKADAEAKKASYAGKPVPVAIERELETISAETAQQAELITRKKKEATAMHAKYDADKQRWRELVAAKGTSGLSAPPATATTTSGSAASQPPVQPSGKK
jgi:hypothetical protein